MTVRYGFGVLLLGAALLAGAPALVSPASACDDSRCTITPQEAPAQPEQPMKLKKFMHRPVASRAVRSVKTADGEYAPVKLTRHGKHRGATRIKAASSSHAKAAPTDIAAGQPSSAPTLETTGVPFPLPGVADATGAVPVVTADQVNDLDRAADTAPNPTNDAAEPVVEVVNTTDLNAGDSHQDVVAAPPTPQVIAETVVKSAERPPNDQPSDASWMKQMLMVLGGAFAAAAAAGRVLMLA